MKVRYTETALAELDQIFTYIAKDNAQAAAVVVDRVEQLVARIGEFPHLAYATDEADVRVIPIGRFPYLMFYTVVGDEVVILHMRHAARLRP